MRGEVLRLTPTPTLPRGRRGEPAQERPTGEGEEESFKIALTEEARKNKGLMVL